ncbi:MAG: hypothetical protein IPM77_02075 [Crocinitomicaceae bacterium]|nr:hypothetical protein [Crocinitomicaceae bacterium]
MILRMAKLSVLIFVFFSCKKDKLEGDKEILIGTWEWYKTEKIYSLCNPPSIESQLTPSSEQTSFSITVYKNGKVTYIEAGQEIATYRIIFTSFDKPNVCSLQGYKYFNINLDNNVNNVLQGCVSEDSLVVIRNFPYPDPEDACENYTSYFVKQ